MSTSPINNALPDTKPRYTQINLCSSLLQETRDTQISQKPIQLSHNQEGCDDSSEPRTPRLKLDCKKATVVKVEHKFGMDYPQSLKPENNNTKIFLNFYKAAVPNPEWLIK